MIDDNPNEAYDVVRSEPDGSPLFTSISLIACWRYEPREHLRPLAIARAAIPPSPFRDRVGYSDHVRFRGYFPVHFIPAYNLPVYASQRPLPDATQDSVRGCSLGFAAAVIADGRLQRACKAQLALDPVVIIDPIFGHGLISPRSIDRRISPCVTVAVIGPGIGPGIGRFGFRQLGQRRCKLPVAAPSLALGEPSRGLDVVAR